MKNKNQFVINGITWVGIAMIAFALAIAALSLGCGGSVLPLPPLNPTCQQWQTAIQDMPAGEAKDAAVALFIEKWPAGCPVAPPPTEPTTEPPTTTTTTTTTQPEAPTARCLPDQEGWLVSTDQTGTLTVRVEAAIAAYCVAHPTEFTDQCSRLADRSAGGVNHFYDGLGAALAAATSPLCAGQVYNSGSRGDMFGARRPSTVQATGAVEDFHIVEYGGFRIQKPLKVNSVWVAPLGAPPEAPPTPGPTAPPTVPPPAGGTLCPAPQPGPPLGPCGLGKIAAKPHTSLRFGPASDPNHCGVAAGTLLRIVDATPQIKCYKDVPQPNFCAKIGSFAAPGAGNMWCPARLEGNAERAACELYALRASGGTSDGFYNWKSTGCILPNPDGNPAQVACVPTGGAASCSLWVCNADLSVCSERITP